MFLERTEGLRYGVAFNLDSLKLDVKNIVILGLLLLFELSLPGQVDTSDVYEQAVALQKEVNKRLLRKYHSRLDTSKVVIISQLFLQPKQTEDFTEGVTEKNYFQKVYLLEHHYGKGIKPNLRIESIILHKDSLKKNDGRLEPTNPILGFYYQYEKTLSPNFGPGDILFYIKNSISLVFKPLGGFPFNNIVVQNGRLFFVYGLDKIKMVDFETRIKERPFVLSMDAFHSKANEDYRNALKDSTLEYYWTD